MTIYEKAADPTVAVMRKMMLEHHNELSEVECRVGVFMATAEKDDDGEPLAPAVMVGGYPCAAKIKINSYRERVEGKPDATIYVDADRWEDLTPDERSALMDHELEHLEVKRDPDSNSPQSDDVGRPKLKIRKHDHQFGWFNSIAKRHGDASFEVRQAKAFADGQGQLYFGWSKPPANSEKPTKNSGRNVTTSDGRKITAHEMVEEIGAQFAK